MTAGVEAALAQRADAFVEHRLGALLFFFEELFGHEALGQEQARRHARHGEQMGFGPQEARQVGALEERALAVLRSVVGEKNLAILHGASSSWRAGRRARWSRARP